MTGGSGGHVERENSDPTGPGPKTGFATVAANVGSLLTSNVVNRATSFVVYAMVASYLGARELGQLALAVSLFQIASRLALLGLRTLITREIAKDHGHTGTHLVTASATAMASSALSLPLIWGFTNVMGYSPETSRVILILFLGLIPFTLAQLTEATFVAWNHSKYVAYANSPIWIAQTIAVLVLLEAGRGVDLVVLSMVVAYFAIAGVQWLVLIAKITRPSWRVQFRSVPAMLRRAAPFLGIDGLNAVRGNVSIVLLSLFTGEAGVGIFAAARQLLVPLNLIFEALGAGVFPTMVRRAKMGIDRLGRLSGRLIELTLALAMPAVAGIFVLAGPLLLLIYRDREFLESVVLVRILIWVTLASALTAILGQILWAGERETTAFRIALTNTLVTVVAALVLIRQFDAVGAAVATLIVGSINVLQHYVPTAGMFRRFELASLAWKPAVATAVMAGWLVVTAEAALWLRIASGAVIYAAVLFGLYVAAAGGYAGLKEELRSARAEG